MAGKRFKVGSKNKAKVEAVEEILRDYPHLEDAEVIGLEVLSNVGDQPRTLEETVRGARNRAENSFHDCDYSVGIELEGLEGDTFELAQYECLAGLVAALAQHYPIAHIAGHEHVAAGRKADPGPGFDWALLQRQLGWPSRCFPEVLSLPSGPL